MKSILALLTSLLVSQATLTAGPVVVAAFNTAQDVTAGRDNHWTITGYNPVTLRDTSTTGFAPGGYYATPYSAYVATSYLTSAWLNNGTDSSGAAYGWVAPSANQGTNGEYAGTFEYNYNFGSELAAAGPNDGTVIVSFQVATDNNLKIVFGASGTIAADYSSQLTTTHYNNWKTVSFAFDTNVEGTAFSIFVDNYDDAGSKASNPSGLTVRNMSITSMAQVPEPSSAALLPMACAMLFCLQKMSRRRR